jgi:hypothetical protein
VVTEPRQFTVVLQHLRKISVDVKPMAPLERLESDCVVATTMFPIPSTGGAVISRHKPTIQTFVPKGVPARQYCEYLMVLIGLLSDCQRRPTYWAFH